MAPEALTSVGSVLFTLECLSRSPIGEDDRIEITRLCDKNPLAQQEREQSAEP